MPFFGPLSLSGFATATNPKPSPADAFAALRSQFPDLYSPTVYAGNQAVGYWTGMGAGMGAGGGGSPMTESLMGPVETARTQTPRESLTGTLAMGGGAGLGDSSNGFLATQISPYRYDPKTGQLIPQVTKGIERPSDFMATDIARYRYDPKTGQLIPEVTKGIERPFGAMEGANPGQSESLTGMITNQGGLWGGGVGDSGAGSTPVGGTPAGETASGSPMGDAGMSPGFSAGFTSPIGSVGQIGMGTFGGQQSSSGLIGQGINSALGIANSGITPGSVANLAMGASPFGLGIANSVLGMVASNISNQNLANTLNTTFTEGAQQGFTPGIYSGLDAGPAPGIGIDTGEAGGGNAPGGPTGDAGGPTASAAAAGEAGSGESGGPGPGEGSGDGSGGGGGGGGAGGSVICTELRRQGYLTDTLWAADEAYGRALDPSIYRGYRRWGGPVASAMKTRPWLTKLIWPIARPAIESMAGRHSWWGDTLLTLGLTVSRRLA